MFVHAGCALHYCLVGAADAPLVVHTHGGMVDHRKWEPQVPKLCPRYRVLLWDVRGHGRSRPGGTKRSIPHVTEDLAVLLDHLGYARAVLVRMSAGGWLVQEYAFRYLDRATALVIVGQCCWTLPPREVRAMAGPWSALLFMLVGLVTPWRLFPRTLMRTGAAHSKPHTRAYLSEVFGQWSKPEFLRHAWHGRGGLRHEPGYRIARPTLITHGEHGTAFVRRDASAWAAREPLSRYVVIPDAGHTVNMDAPEAFNAALQEFLTSVEDAARSEVAQGTQR